MDTFERDSGLTRSVLSPAPSHSAPLGMRRTIAQTPGSEEPACAVAVAVRSCGCLGLADRDTVSGAVSSLSRALPLGMRRTIAHTPGSEEPACAVAVAVRSCGSCRSGHDDDDVYWH